MDAYASHRENARSYLQSGYGLARKLQEYGCPMMDDTWWVQGESGQTFASPDGTGVAAYWLPCIVPTETPVLPGTCENCELYASARPRNE